MNVDDAHFMEYMALAPFTGVLVISRLPETRNETYDALISRFNRKNRKPVTLPTLAEYLAELREEHGSTARLTRAAFRKSFLIMFEAEKPEASVRRAIINERFKSIRLGLREARIPVAKVPSREDIEKLLHSSDERVSLPIRFLMETGMRATELCGIRLSDVTDELDKSASVEIMGRSRRQVSVRKDLIDDVQRCFKGTTHLFETTEHNPMNRKYLWRIISDASMQILGKKISGKHIRHFHIVRNIRDGQGVEAVFQHAGNRSLSIAAEMYLHSEMFPPREFDPSLAREPSFKRIERVKELLRSIDMVYRTVDSDRRLEIKKEIQTFLEGL